MLGLALLGPHDADQLAFLELVLTDETARIAPRRARLGAEAQGQRGEPQRERAFVEQFAHDARGERNFAGRDEPAIIGRTKTILGKLRQLVGAVHRLVPDKHGRVAFLIPMLARLHVEHELAERAVQPGHVTAQEGEARPRKPCAGFEIHAERWGKVGMFQRGKVERAWRAPPRDFDIVVLARASGHIVGGQVGNDRQLRS